MPVYIIRAGDTDMVKIGFTRDTTPSRRLRKMQTDNHEKLVLLRWLDGDQATELRIQKMFNTRRLRGDWYRFCKSMMGDLGASDLPLTRNRSDRIFPADGIAGLIARTGSLVKFAGLAGVHHSTAHGWKKGNFLPGSRVPRIAKALDVPAADLVPLIREPPEPVEAA